MKKVSQEVQIESQEEKKAQTTREKNAAIENSVSKQKVRADGRYQAEKIFSYLGLMKARILTLPAMHSYFEHGLEHDFLRHNINTELQFFGVEMDRKLVADVFRNMPKNSIMSGFYTIEDFIKYVPKVRKSGFALLNMNEIRKTPFMFELGWFDYCSYINKENINHFIDCIINNINQGMIMITCDLSVRGKDGSKEYAKQFSGYRKGYSLHKTIVETLGKEIKEKVKGKKVRLVIDDEYGGGTLGRTTMLTLGYTVNIPKSVVAPIVANYREGMADIKYKRNSTYNFLKDIQERKRFNVKCLQSDTKKVKGTGKIGRPRKEKSPERIRLEQAVSRWATKWHLVKKEKKLKIVAKYGVSSGSWGSMIAHYHMPASWNGNVGKGSQKKVA